MEIPPVLHGCLTPACSGLYEQSLYICDPQRGGKKREEKLGKPKGEEIKTGQDISGYPL